MTPTEQVIAGERRIIPVRHIHPGGGFLFNGDCRTILYELEPKKHDLIFADPPFGIGYGYDVHDDRMDPETYRTFTRNWLDAANASLSHRGSIFVAIGDEGAGIVKMELDRQGLYFRNWIVWHYTFGVNCQKKFTRSHTHILYYTKHKTAFTFNADAIREPSARQTVYGDKRANPKGRIPDDVWKFPRLCGTHKERLGHPCQMPESVMRRIIAVGSNEGDSVFDPFAGSGTTLAVAKKMGRVPSGYELSPNYYRVTLDRLQKIDIAESPA